MIATTINYKCFDGVQMAESHLNLNDIIRHLPRKSDKGRDISCFIHTCVKAHCFDDEKDFVIEVKGGKIKNPEIISEINNYLLKNNARSFFYEGLRSAGNGKYYLMWGS